MQGAVEMTVLQQEIEVEIEIEMVAEEERGRGSEVLWSDEDRNQGLGPGEEKEVTEHRIVGLDMDIEVVRNTLGRI